jgi:hypothetical protein
MKPRTTVKAVKILSGRLVDNKCILNFYPIADIYRLKK